MTPIEQALNKHKKEIKKANGLLNLAIRNKDDVKIDEAFGLAEDNLMAAVKLYCSFIESDTGDIWFFMNILELKRDIDKGYDEVQQRVHDYHIAPYL